MEGRWPCPQYCVATRVGGGSWALWEATGFPSISGRDLKLERATHRGVSSLSLEVYKQRLLLLWLFPALCPFLLTRRILKTCFRHSAPCPDVSQGPLLPLGSSTNPPSPRQYLTGSWSVESGFALGGEGEALEAGRAWGGQASGAREMGVRQEGQPPRAGGGREGPGQDAPPCRTPATRSSGRRWFCWTQGWGPVASEANGTGAGHGQGLFFGVRTVWCSSYTQTAHSLRIWGHIREGEVPVQWSVGLATGLRL